MNITFVFSLLLILTIVSEHQTHGQSEGRGQQWFYIMSQVKGDCLMALDVHHIDPHCPGTKVIANALDPYKTTQQWRWDGHQLINRYSGLAVKLDATNTAVLSHGTNAPNQQFSTKNDGGYIFTNTFKQLGNVLGLQDKLSSKPGTGIIAGPGVSLAHQHYNFVPVGF